MKNINEGALQELYRGWAWLAVPPLSVLLYLALDWLLPLLVSPAQPGYGADLFLADTAQSLLPEPREQAGYLLAIALIPLAFTGWALYVKRKQALLGAIFSAKLIGVWALVSQMLVVLCAAIMWGAHLSDKKPCFGPGELAVAGLLACAVVLALFSRRVSSSVKRAEERAERVPFLAFVVVAEALCIWLLLPSIFTEANLSDALVNVRAHIPFIVDEFSAVLNGRVILVDYFPQYQKLMSYFMAPYFAVFGVGTLPFTISMGVLSLTGLLCVYFTFQIITRRRLFSFLLFVGFLGSCAVASNSRLYEVFYMFNYYPMSPVRYFAPWVGGLLLAFYLRYPSAKKLWALAVFCGLAALNNPDFGLPVMVGALTALSLGRAGKLFASFGNIRRAALMFGAGLGGAVLLFAAGTRLLGGQWPRFAEMFMYQKIFAATGFMLLPMPQAGLHWLVYFTFMAGIGTAVVGALRGETDEEDIVGPMLMFGCVAGCGMAMYYVGRSHQYVLPAIFPAWYFVLALLSLKAADGHGSQSWLGRLTSVVPLWLVVFHVLALGMLLDGVPSPLSQMKRLGSGSGEFLPSYDMLVELTKKYAAPGEKVGIVSMYAHNLAISAGVDNVFPFAHKGSLLLKSQVRESMASFERNNVTKVFGMMPPELELALWEKGFKPTPLVSNGVYTLWRKADR